MLALDMDLIAYDLPSGKDPSTARSLEADILPDKPEILRRVLKLFDQDSR